MDSLWHVVKRHSRSRSRLPIHSIISDTCTDDALEFGEQCEVAKMSEERVEHAHALVT